RIRFSPSLRDENLRSLERIFEVNQRCVRELVYCVLMESGGHNERLSCEILQEGAWRKWPRSRRLPVLPGDSRQHPRRGGGKSKEGFLRRSSSHELDDPRGSLPGAASGFAFLNSCAHRDSRGQAATL